MSEVSAMLLLLFHIPQYLITKFKLKSNSLDSLESEERASCTHNSHLTPHDDITLHGSAIQLMKQAQSNWCGYILIAQPLWCPSFASCHCVTCWSMHSLQYQLHIPAFNYHEISDISGTKSQNSNISCLGLQLSLHNILKPGVKWRMKM